MDEQGNPQARLASNANKRPASLQGTPTMSARGHWIISTMLVLATAVGFWLFSSGFLLTRNVLPNHSQAAVLPFATTSDAPGTPEAHGSDVPLQGGGCGWYEPKFERTIILVIDAMRADFAMWSDELNNLTRPANEGSGKETEALELLPYHNRVPIIGTKCKDNPEQSMLYRFRADPPTTTLQRLKGLTTGQLPTFIDAGSNFAGSAIAEDNWLQAMRWPTLYSCNQSDTSQGTRGYKRNLAFLGDDTWISLFPEELSDTRASEMDDTAAWAETFDSGRGWARVRPFPSLNVWDLDTVDDGVLSRLPFFLLPPEPLDGATENQDIAQERARWRQLVRQKEMLTHADFNGADSPMFSDHVGAQQLHDDWDVIVAHTLGVDHCGHRYGPSHPAISHKLSQMNEMLELVVSAVDRSDKSTVLYVFGDHGMDPKGDHGGDSPREVDAALWVYSNTKWTGTEAQQRTDRVLEATAKILDGLPLGAGLDDDLRKGWWFNTHLSEDYGKKNGVPVVKPPKMRSVPQIDLVSTLSLVLGLHVPFNNLGAVIPELFAADTSSTNSEWGLLRALRLNAAQVIRYLETYMASSKSHGFSDEAVLAWRDLYQRAETSYRELTDIIARNPGAHKQPNIMQMEEDVAAQYFVFLRIVLGTLRQMWAQFDAVLIIAGLSIILVVLVTLVTVYFASRNWSMRGIVEMTWKQSTGGAFAVAVAARAFNVMLNTWAMTHMSQVQATAAGAALGSMLVFSAVLILHTWRHNDNTVVEDSSTLSEHGFMTPVFGLNAVVCVLCVIHFVAFSSNSYTFSEDGIVHYLLQTLIVVSMLVAAKSLRKSATDRQKKAGKRSLICLVAILVLNRVSLYSTVCREEQMPMCIPTFYGSPSASISSVLLALVNCIMVWLVPMVVQRILKRSRSDRAMVARLWVSIGMRITMGMSAAYWVLDSIDGALSSASTGTSTTVGGLGEDKPADWSELRLVLARMAVGIAIGGGFAAWYASPFCLDVAISEAPATLPGKQAPRTTGSSAPQQTAIVLGYGNAYGAAYLIFTTVVFCILYLVQQPMGGIMLSLLFIKTVLCAESYDALQDALGETRRYSLVPVKMAMLAMLAYQDYFSTGHQFTLVSIQWSTAFVGVREMQLIVCGCIVALNTFGSFILSAISVPLVVLWNESLGSQTLRLDPEGFVSTITGAAAIFAAYHIMVATGTAFFAAWFRRHLMVWKIFAPRFMFSVPAVLVSVVVVFGVAIGFATVRILRLGLQVGNVQTLVAQKMVARR